MAALASIKVVFEQDGIFLHSSSDRSDDHDSLTSGSLRVIEKEGGLVVEYKPLEEPEGPSCVISAGQDSSSGVGWPPRPADAPPRQLGHQLTSNTEWDVINGVYFRNRPSHSGDATMKHNAERSGRSQSFRLVDLASIKLKTEGWPYLVFSLRDHSVSPAFHFHRGGTEGFLDCLRRFVLLTETSTTGAGTTLLVSSQYKVLSQSFENLLDDATFGLITKFKKDPYSTTLGGFSKVTHYLLEAFRGADTEPRQGPDPLSEVIPGLEAFRGADTEPRQGPDPLSEVIPGLEIDEQEEPGFEVITRIDLGARPQVERREPVSADEWLRCVDDEGRPRDPEHLKHLIFKGGLSHGLRKEVWKFLLGYFPWDSTSEERQSLQKKKTDEYFRMKLQWKSVSEEQEKRNSKLRDHRSLIEKDVNRTDRSNAFYEGPENPGVSLLHDLLMTYCMYDFDLGYVQGMSDLLSPILYVMENEVDSFWCFVSFMEQMHQNFEEQMQGMKTQLIQLSTLLRLLDLSFWTYLEAQDSGYLYFCFRWLLIRFKRELSFRDVLRLWEILWTGLPCQNFHLLVCFAILDSEKQTIMDNRYGFNEILKHINDLSMKLDIDAILHKAEALCVQLKNCKDIPASVRAILGFDADSGAVRSKADLTVRDSERDGSPEERGPVIDPPLSTNEHLRAAARDVYKLAYIS